MNIINKFSRDTTNYNISEDSNDDYLFKRPK